MEVTSSALLGRESARLVEFASLLHESIAGAHRFPCFPVGTPAWARPIDSKWLTR
jgi:hypothetical protein